MSQLYTVKRNGSGSLTVFILPDIGGRMLKNLQPECEETLNCFTKHLAKRFLPPVCSQIIKEKVVDKMGRRCYDEVASKDTAWEAFSRFTLSQLPPTDGGWTG